MKHTGFPKRYTRRIMSVRAPAILRESSIKHSQCQIHPNIRLIQVKISRRQATSLSLQPFFKEIQNEALKVYR